MRLYKAVNIIDDDQARAEYQELMAKVTRLTRTKQKLLDAIRDVILSQVKLEKLAEEYYSV